MFPFSYYAKHIKRLLETNECAKCGEANNSNYIFILLSIISDPSDSVAKSRRSRSLVPKAEPYAKPKQPISTLLFQLHHDLLQTKLEPNRRSSGLTHSWASPGFVDRGMCPQMVNRICRISPYLHIVRCLSSI